MIVAWRFLPAASSRSQSRAARTRSVGIGKQLLQILLAHVPQFTGGLDVLDTSDPRFIASLHVPSGLRKSHLQIALAALAAGATPWAPPMSTPPAEGVDDGRRVGVGKCFDARCRAPPVTKSF